jgi:hypothetical protein
MFRRHDSCEVLKMKQLPSENKKAMRGRLAKNILISIIVLAAFLAIFVRLPETNSYFTSTVESEDITLD